MSNQKKNRIVPRLRFPEFKDAGEWERKKLIQVCKINPTNNKLPIKFVYVDLESVQSGVLVKKNIILLKDAPSRAQRILKVGDIIFQMVRPYQKNNYFFQSNDNLEYVASTGYAQLRAHESNGYLYHYIHNDKFVNSVLDNSTGSNYPAINSSYLSEIIIAIPKSKEQQKIADCLTSIDELIKALSQKVEILKEHKKGLMQKLFPVDGNSLPQLRFPEFKDSGEWKVKKLGECLDYLQPTQYLVKSTRYDDSYKTPVLTAGKTFVLGYTNETHGIYRDKLPVIIFDDFTTATKFVEFPFKAKSSAMKILVAEKKTNTKFIYEAMQVVKYEIGSHERHWISKFAKLDGNYSAIKRVH